MGQQSANGVDRSEYRAGVYFAVVMHRLERDELTTAAILMRRREHRSTFYYFLFASYAVTPFNIENLFEIRSEHRSLT